MIVTIPEDPDDDDTTGDKADPPDTAFVTDDTSTMPEPQRRHKYYVDTETNDAGIAATVIYELDAYGKRLRFVEYTTFAAEGVRTLYATPDEMRPLWLDERQRRFLIETLREQGIDLETLLDATGRPDADPFDALCHVAWGAPLRTRRERADHVRKYHADFFDKYGPKARAILDALLDKYTTYGPDQLAMPDALKLPPMSDYGNVVEIAGLFGGLPALRAAIDTLIAEIYEG